jgi:succinyl-diaminopimelate desuccinylase
MLAVLHSLADQVDAAWPGTPRTLVEVTARWPAYQLPDDSRLKAALLVAALGSISWD